MQTYTVLQIDKYANTQKKEDTSLEKIFFLCWALISYHQQRVILA